ncbi:MAG: shikimate kinase [Paenibacillaceae bacterium]
MKDRNIVLVGFMGTGKTTIGRMLAKQMNWSFVDTDATIEQEQGAAVSQLFETQGESQFRRIETETLKRVLTASQQVIATGGGAVLAQENCNAMLQDGFVVALTADYTTIIRRVSDDQARPLLNGDLRERVTTLLEQRKTAYDFADLKLDTSKRSIEQIIESILNRRREALD